jgi:drug/metabolite transporter (DMT)-like permease
VRASLRLRLVAAILSLAAAFLWSTYYLFVLGVSPSTRPSAVLFYPFLGGGAAYAIWVLARGDGPRLGRAFADPRAYLRVGLLLGMQLSVLAATYLAGPVDASLLSLLGDVVATPLVVAALFAEHRRELRAPALVAGLLLSLAGGTLAIAGGHPPAAVHDLGWLAVVAVPLTVAFYFVLSARAGATIPVQVVVAQSMAAAAVGALAIAPLLPGGLAGIVSVRPLPLALLLVNGLSSFFLAPVLYFRAIERAGLVFPPMLMTGIPVFTLLLSAAILGIAPAAVALLGVPVAAVGGLVALSAGASGPDRPATASR